MAIIHTARNDLAGKLDKTRMQGRSALYLRCGLGLAAGILAFLLMLGHFDFGMTVRTFVSDFLQGSADWVMDLFPGFDFFENQWGRSLISILLDMGVFVFLTILKILVYLFLWLGAVIFPSVVRISLYALPMALTAYCLYALLSGLSRSGSQEEDILRSGLLGEEKALSLLRGLGDDCHIFTNLRIPYDGGESETDMIVVTPGGITIVEVKNHKGILTGDASEEQLTQRKPFRSGGAQTKLLHNPIRQVGTHAYRLAGWLRSHGIHAYVHTCVLFVNPEAELQLSDRKDVLSRKCPVFTIREIYSLSRYLTDSAQPLSSREYQRTVQLLEVLTDRSHLSNQEV